MAAYLVAQFLADFLSLRAALALVCRLCALLLLVELMPLLLVGHLTRLGA